jgi:hypothetical protein
MYESILKVATGDPDFKYKLKSTPFHPTFEFHFKFTSFTSGLIVLYTAISYSTLLTTVVSYLVHERIAGLKHLQLISGMQKKAYWIGNFIIDFAKLLVTILATIACFKTFEMSMDNVVWTYLALPFGVLPFTYVSSFVFSSDSAA